MLIGSQAIDQTAIFIICSQRKLCDRRENGTAGILSMEKFTLISGPWYSVGSGISVRVLRTNYLACMSRVACLFHPLSKCKGWNGYLD